MIETWQQMVALARAEVDATLRSLPPPLREKARALPVTCEPWPNDALVEEGLAADTLGLFVGGDYGAGEHELLPSQIILYLDNIADMVEDDEAAFRAEVRTTLLHELGHYLGLDEDELLDRGLE
jgi:predicted Zn-dependent protease with MMP-like domain